MCVNTGTRSSFTLEHRELAHDVRIVQSVLRLDLFAFVAHAWLKVRAKSSVFFKTCPTPLAPKYRSDTRMENTPLRRYASSMSMLDTASISPRRSGSEFDAVSRLLLIGLALFVKSMPLPLLQHTFRGEVNVKSHGPLRRCEVFPSMIRASGPVCCLPSR